MDLALSDDQVEFRRAARRFATDRLRDDGPIDARAWSDIHELGWLGLALPENSGGSAASTMDVAVIFEEIGRAAGSPLLFDTAVLGPAVLNSLDEPWAHDLLAAVLNGDAKVAVVVGDGLGLPEDRATKLSCHIEPSGDIGLSGDIGPSGDIGSGALSGTVASVRDAGDVDYYLVLAPTAGGAVAAMVDGAADGVTAVRREGFAPHHHQVTFAAVAMAAATEFAIDSATYARVRAAIIDLIPVHCAYQVGSCQAVYEMSVEYSRERVQFGKPIGSFQRVQDHVIQLINGTDSARWVTNHAIWMIDSGAGLDDREMAVHVAKAVTAQAHLEACTSAHEVHAGIGADLQYGLARHTFASRSMYARFGAPDWHRHQIARRLRSTEQAPGANPT